LDVKDQIGPHEAKSMRLSLALVAAFLVAAVAGCIGAPGQTMTMRDGLGDAREAAEAWGDGLRFAFAAAVEPFKHIEDRDRDGTLRGEYVTHLDGNPGDGRAPGWIYGFLADDGRCVSIVLAAGLGVLAEGWEECDADEVAPLPANVLDSDEVAALLKADGRWITPDKSTVMTWTLASEDEGEAYWLVWGSNQTAAMAAVVDAVHGNVSFIDADADGTIFESGSETAFASAPLLTPVSPLSVSLDLEGDGGALHVSAAVSTSVVGLAMLRVIAPNGDVLLAESVPGSADFELAGLPPGRYEARLEHSNVAMMPSLTLTSFWFRSD
jgi:hypothetical protein